MSDELRTYFGSKRPEPTGTPEWSRAKSPKAKCPNCGAHLCEISVPVKEPRVRGGTGTCAYLGCPACPYASPSMITSDSVMQ